MFDLINVVQGDAKLPQALIRDKRLDDLCLLPASQTRDKDALDRRRRRPGHRRAAREIRLDHLRQPGRHRARRARSPCAMPTLAIVVTNPGSLLGARLRPHHRAARFEDREGREAASAIDKHLLLTRYDAARAARGEMLTIEDVLEILSIPLLGIIPESEEVAARLEPRLAGHAQQSAERSRRAPISTRRAGSRARTVAMTVPSESKGCSTSCSDGERHEACSNFFAARHRAGRARTAADPARARARRSRGQPDLLGRPARGNSRRDQPARLRSTATRCRSRWIAASRFRRSKSRSKCRTISTRPFDASPDRASAARASRASAAAPA